MDFQIFEFMGENETVLVLFVCLLVYVLQESKRRENIMRQHNEKREQELMSLFERLQESYMEMGKDVKCIKKKVEYLHENIRRK